MAVQRKNDEDLRRVAGTIDVDELALSTWRSLRIDCPNNTLSWNEVREATAQRMAALRGSTEPRPQTASTVERY